ncbi:MULTISPECIES: DUF4112 domain-containing protein [Kordiimonas]|jgi:hypothetical protein|uniref:DUF4112 domain-containing protein n=1 Tax=Kordiimonas TaxID=288021 RepID=UPI00257BFFCC|nr:DUF4112 domain-containing protein [Kordiimonas sp. UBA4487]
MATPGHNSLSDLDRKRLKRVHRLARLLDSQFRIPGTNIRFGLDSIVGLLPVAGDTVTATLAAYIIFEAFRIGVRRTIIVRMLGNLVIDWVVGSIPVIGDLFDVGFKANQRNIRLIERDLGVALADL